jgi:hypothetical protein
MIERLMAFQLTEMELLTVASESGMIRPTWLSFRHGGAEAVARGLL